MKKIFNLFIFYFLTNINAFDYFPLSVGNMWVLIELDSNGTTIGKDSSCIESEFIQSNMRLFRFNEFISDSLSSFLSTSYIYSNGNDVSYIYDTANVSNYLKMAQHIYKDGDNWYVDDPLFDCTFWVEYYGNVEVPAGKFDSCYFVHHDSTSGWVFAPNVGFVKTIEGNKDCYVLKSYKIDNSNSVSKIIKKELPYTFQINTLPNSNIEICFDSPNKISQLIIFAIDGKKLVTFYNNNSFTLESSLFSSGLYIIRVNLGGKYYSKSISLIKK